MADLDLENHMLKLAEVATSGPANRVFVWRKLLTQMWQQGFEDGQMAERRDRRVVALLAKEEAAAEAPE